KIALPPGIAIASVERHSTRRDRGIPVVDRLLHSRLRGPFADPGSRIIEFVGDHRPAMCAARPWNVAFATAHGAVFQGPDLPGLGIERGALRVAMAVRPDLRPG